MIIGACGFGGTGSSVITDYLAEFDSIQVVGPTEFDWVSHQDGLIDLEYHLKHPHGRYGDAYKAIERYQEMCRKKVHTLQKLGVSKSDFINSVNDFIDSITQAEWTIPYDPIPYSSYVDKVYRVFLEKTNFILKWEKKHKMQWEKYPYRRIKYAGYPENFDDMARSHVMDVIGKMGVDFNKPIVFDQPFSGENPQACLKYFDDPYAIVVDKDPRDLYIWGKTFLAGRYPFHIMPLNDVKSFVAFYRGLRHNQPYKESHERVLSLKLGDLIYKYDETTKRLRDFLKLPENPHPKSIFDPSVSMANTQLWLRFPEFENDVNYIEQELQEYLYDYSGCPKPGPDSKIFEDRSPKLYK